MSTKSSIGLFGLMLTLLLLNCNYELYTQGQRIYEAQCANCHMDNGEGLKSLIPDISDSKYILGSPQDLICLIRKGIPDNRDDGLQMPGYKDLSDVEMCNLVNFLQSKWKADFEEVQIKEMDELEKNCVD